MSTTHSFRIPEGGVSRGDRVIIDNLYGYPFPDTALRHPTEDRSIVPGDVVEVELVSSISYYSTKLGGTWSGYAVFWKLPKDRVSSYMTADASPLGAIPAINVAKAPGGNVYREPQEKECRCVSLLFGHEKGCPYAS